MTTNLGCNSVLALEALAHAMVLQLASSYVCSDSGLAPSHASQVIHDDPPSLTKDEPIRDARYRVTDIFER